MIDPATAECQQALARLRGAEYKGTSQGENHFSAKAVAAQDEDPRILAIEARP